MAGEQNAAFHIENGVVAAYLDGRLDVAERAQVEAHLADCSACRDDVVAVTRLRRSIPRRSRWLIAVPAAAAAGLAIAVLWPREGEPPGGPVLRDGAEGIATVVTLAPLDDAVTPHDSVRFKWRSLGADVSYRLTLTSAQGDVIWTGATADTTLALSRDVRLSGGSAYSWYVDALLPDGRTATSGVRRLRVTR